MAKMTKNATTGKYELEITPSASAQTKTIKSSGKYCDADMDVKVSAVPTFDFDTQSSQIYYPNHAYCPLDLNSFTIKSLMVTTVYSSWPSNYKIPFTTLDEPRYFVTFGNHEFAVGNSSSRTGSSWTWSGSNVIIKVVLTYNSGTTGRKITIYRRIAGATSWTQCVSAGYSYTEDMYLWVRNNNNSSTRQAANILMEVYPPSGLK